MIFAEALRPGRLGGLEDGGADLLQPKLRLRRRLRDLPRPAARGVRAPPELRGERLGALKSSEILLNPLSKTFKDCRN